MYARAPVCVSMSCKKLLKNFLHPIYYNCATKYVFFSAKTERNVLDRAYFRLISHGE